MLLIVFVIVACLESIHGHNAMVWTNDQYLLAGRGICFENSFFASC